ncbi:secreted frizzled-related protein 1-like [Arapaima gigas]
MSVHSSAPLWDPRRKANRAMEHPPVSSLRWRPALLTLTLTLTLALESVLVLASDHNAPDLYLWGHGHSKKLQCVDIPTDLNLCHNVGYRSMLLPNLLDHEIMAEVRQQAGSWVPLVNKKCHPNTQVFLCSLFAPVCLDTPIFPCRWLCKEVRDACSPIMESYGFPWPEMLACDKFPEADPCIAVMTNTTDPQKPTGSSTACPPCNNGMKTEAILEHLCASEFVIKAKIKQVKQENLDRKVILQKRKKVLKMGNLKKKDLKQLTLHLKFGANCPCHQLDHLSGAYLIMGRKVDKQYLLTDIRKWDKSSEEFKAAIRKIKAHSCPTFQTFLK